MAIGKPCIQPQVWENETKNKGKKGSGEGKMEGERREGIPSLLKARHGHLGSSEARQLIPGPCPHIRLLVLWCGSHKGLVRMCSR